MTPESKPRRPRLSRFQYIYNIEKNIIKRALKDMLMYNEHFYTKDEKTIAKQLLRDLKRAKYIWKNKESHEARTSPDANSDVKP
jgi:hypothetical protein